MKAGRPVIFLRIGRLGIVKSKRTVLISDKWISFVAEFVKIRVIDPDILRKLKLPYEACTKNECRNSTIDAIFWRAFRQSRAVGRATADHSSALDVRRRVPRVHSPNMRS